MARGAGVSQDDVVFRRTDGLEEIPMGKQVALYRGDMEKAIVLNRVGSLVWERLETPQTRAALVDAVAAKFPSVERERLDRDVATYLGVLVSHRIVVEVEG
jgi:hypothetical protein